jgi:integrase
MLAAKRAESGLQKGDAIPKWTLHDLRRTAATGMARLNFPPHVVEKVLNHASGTIRGVAAVYNRFAYLDERRSALEAWGGTSIRL